MWTNIIDNAIEALDGKGTISIRTSREHDHILVEIGDNDPGISPDVQSRIIVSRHHGDIRVVSNLGSTCFEVRLPIG